MYTWYYTLYENIYYILRVSGTRLSCLDPTNINIIIIVIIFPTIFLQVTTRCYILQMCDYKIKEQWLYFAVWIWIAVLLPWAYGGHSHQNIDGVCFKFWLYFIIHNTILISLKAIYLLLENYFKWQLRNFIDLDC